MYLSTETLLPVVEREVLMGIWKALFPSLPLRPAGTIDAEMPEDFLAGCPTQRYLGQTGNVLSLLSAQLGPHSH